jgi:ABC-type phosphate transport system auxiliary subunit
MSPLMIPMLALSIPLFGMLFAAFKRWADLKEKQLELTSSLTAEKSAQYAAQTERLEERVRVLERILTDRGVEVAAQIEALRDPVPTRLTHDS